MLLKWTAPPTFATPLCSIRSIRKLQRKSRFIHCSVRTSKSRQNFCSVFDANLWPWQHFTNIIKLSLENNKLKTTIVAAPEFLSVFSTTASRAVPCHSQAFSTLLV
jgi:hypothetical protein